MTHFATPKDTPYIEIVELEFGERRFQWTICVRTFSGHHFRTTTTGRELTVSEAAEAAHAAMRDGKFKR